MNERETWPLGLNDILTAETIFVGTLAELMALNNASDATRNECSAMKSVENHGSVSGQPTESGEFRDSTAP